MLLLAAAIAALLWANAPGTNSYATFWDSHITLDFDVLTLDESLRQWVNDGLMVLFFFVVGLEIKRELVRGELAGVNRALLPGVAALGGMVIPALFYTSFNAGGEGARGWGIPMATDIAFAVGVLSLLGTRVPVALKVFVLALAIVDDIGAITVIAIFYTDDVDIAWLGAGIAALAAALALGRFGVRALWVYVGVGLFAWLGVFESGVHATIAGVALGLITPSTARFSEEEFNASLAHLAQEIDEGGLNASESDRMDRGAALQELEELAQDSRPVLDRLEHTLHPWTSFFVIPVFALANSGVDLGSGALTDAMSSPISLGVAAGLVLGKPIGICLFAFVAVRIGLTALPEGVRWGQIIGASIIAGIGFTVSIFITELAFDDAALVDEAKIAVLAGSAISAVVGFVVLRAMNRRAAGESEEASV